MPRYIDADKAKETLRHLLYETAMNNELDIADIYEDIIENRLDTWIELIPTVDATTAKNETVGHWENYLAEGLRWKCSECGSRFETPYHYCPNCGARMG